MARPRRPHAATIARLPHSKPAPVVDGSQAVKKASKKCLIGNSSAKCKTPLGISDSGMKTPERKYSGRSAKFVIGAAASSEGIAAVIAKPRQQNDAAPTVSVTSTAGRWSHGIATS